MFRALFVGITRTKVLTLSAVVMAVVNVMLDYLLIFGHAGLPKMGIQGAAIASVHLPDGRSPEVRFEPFPFVRPEAAPSGTEHFGIYDAAIFRFDEHLLPVFHCRGTDWTA